MKTIAEIFEQALAYVPDHLKEEYIALAKQKAAEGNIYPESSSNRFGSSWGFNDGSPILLTSLVSLLAEGEFVESVIDPVCGGGLLLSVAAKATGAPFVDGIDKNTDAIRYAKFLLGETANLFNVDMFSEIKFPETYGLIVADPPLNARLTGAQCDYPGLPPGAEFLDGLLLWITENLSADGRAMITVAPSFFYATGSRSSHCYFQTLGLKLTAAILLPPGTRFDTNIPTYLLIIERGSQGKVFVAQADEDKDELQKLVSNFKKGKLTDNPNHGRYAEFDDFHGFDAFVSKVTLARLIRKLGWTSHRACCVFLDWQRVPQTVTSEDEICDADTIFLKLNGRCMASADLNDMRTGASGKIREVVRLKVNRSLADVSYLVHWLNDSKVGRLLIESHLIGMTVPRMRLEDFLASEIALPDIQAQKATVMGAAKLRKVEAEIEELRGELLSGEANSDQLMERIDTINQEDRYTEWIDTLPFPLASILYRHYAMSGQSSKLKYVVLLHFFEASAAFIATIHLSAFMSSQQIWESYRQAISEKLRENKLSLDRPTFGTWKLLGELLSSAGSSLRKDSSEVDLITKMYGTKDARILDMLFDSRTAKVIQTANKIRNNWGHGGAVGEEQAREIHNELEDLVQQLRAVWGQKWRRYQLIEPGSSRYRNGIHHTIVKQVIGTRSPFVESEVESTQPLEDCGLYLFDLDQCTGLQLKPFIRVMPSPDKQALACFIYNRLEGEDAKWVSYHFEQESEIIYSATDLEGTLSGLRG